MAAVLDYLQGRGVTFQVIPHPPAETPMDEASVIGVDPAEVAKTTALVDGEDVVIAVVLASDVLDPESVALAIGEDARPASEAEIVRAFPDYEAGALPPLGLLLRAPMYVDPAVMERDTIVFAAGRRTQSIRIRTEDLFRGDPIVVTSLARRQKDHVVKVDEAAEVRES